MPGKNSVIKLNLKNMELSLMLNLKLKLTSQKAISILSKSNLLTKKNPKKGNISILKKLVSLQNKLGLNFQKKNSWNMFCLKNLVIKPTIKKQKMEKVKKINLKMKAHLKVEEDQNLNLVKLSIKKAQNPL